VLFGCATRVIASSDLGAVHEWGTFTSVAGEDGAAMSWQTLSGPSDLPCFVHRLDQRDLKAAGYGTVRMETPVLYFYPLKPLTVSVHVDFPNGRVTEWFPHASSVQPSNSRRGWIEWKDVQVSRGSEPLPRLGEASHYYAARETEAWPLKSEQENEKLLFYRGIGNFAVDLRAVVNHDGVSIRNAGAETIPEAIVFENRAGKSGYQIIHRLREPVSVNFSALTGTINDLGGQLEEELTEMGLYRNEARAMIETWRDSWFEEGLRVFYILPRSEVDALLPISIQPPMGQPARVFVGRVELLSPHMKQEINAALANGDVAVLKKHGRFLNAFLREMSNGRGDPPMCERARQFLEIAYSQALAESRKISCAQ
jgi:hypothetical protein